MKPQSYEVFFRSDTGVVSSQAAGSVLWQVPFYGKGMKKDKLPSNTKSNPNFLDVF